MAAQTVLVLGASPKPERYSHQAVVRLHEAGHRVIPVHPAAGEVHGLPCLRSLAEARPPVDTVTLYVNAEVSDKFREDLLRLRPKRLIFNPGAENPALAEAARAAGIETLEACTLVLLSTHAF